MNKLLEAVKEASTSVTHLQDQITIIKKYLDPFTVEELDIIKEDKIINPSEWITKGEIKQARVEAKKIWEDFCNDMEACDGEQSWTEIKINDKFFDIECYDEECDRTGIKQEMYCNIYPVIFTENGWRETDGTRWVRLFSKGEVTE